METNQVLETIRSRRTIRRYTTKPVSDQQVKMILTAAMSAPSLMGRAPWHFVVLREADTKKLLADQLRLHPYIEAAPVVIVALADETVSPAWRLDMSAAMENLLLQAVSAGLGSAWIGAPDLSLTLRAEQSLREKVGLPENMRLFALASLGYPAEERPPHELDLYFLSTRVHYEKWDDLKFRGE